MSEWESPVVVEVDWDREQPMHDTQCFPGNHSKACKDEAMAERKERYARYARTCGCVACRKGN